MLLSGRVLSKGLCVLLVAASLTGCGGSSGSSSSVSNGGSGSGGGADTGSGGSGSGGGTPPETIQGVATPSSVAVVTATNAE